MEGIFQWGIEMITALQQFRSPLLDSFFLNITALGSDIFYFLVFAFLFWCVDDRETAGFAVLFCLSFWINSELKRFLDQPRPYNLVPELKIGHCSGGGGLPSYHAQGSFLFWCYLSIWFRRVPVYVISVVLIILIAMSRVYLGRHFPTDIFGGWILSLILLAVFYAARPRIREWFEKSRLYSKITIALIIPFLLSLVKPSSWTVSAMGFLAGFGAGYCILREYINFNVKGAYANKAARYIAGLAGFALINYVMKEITPAREHDLFLLFVFSRFMLMGLWMSAGAPYLFTKMGLVRAEG